jgi:hypothetical protein
VVSRYLSSAKYAPAYLALWGLAASASVVSYFGVSQLMWAAETAVSFFGLETFALYMLQRGNTRWPPLTFAVRRYTPRWLAFSLLYSLVGYEVIRAVEAGRNLIAATLIGFIGWLTAHFDVTFDEQ